MRLHRLHAISAALLCALLPLLCACGSKQQEKPAAPRAARTDTVGRIVMEVSRCARLYTSEYQIHKIVTHTDKPVLEGQVLNVPVRIKTRIGERKVAIPIDVTLKAYIDFTDFSTDNLERKGHTLTVTLPDPQIVATASRVDHRGTRQYIDLTRSRYSDAELADLARQGADSILSHTAQLGIIENARQSAANTLLPILLRMGYNEQDVVIRFRKPFTDNEVLRMIRH